MQQYELKVILGLVLLLVFTVSKGDREVDLDGDGEVVNFNRILSRQMKNFTTAQRKFQREMLNAHNNYRSRHCARPLRLDDNLSRSAQNYAQRLANINTMVHSGIKGLGENLYMMTSSSKITTIAGSKATSAWYDEIKYYNFSRPIFSTKTDHFTQVIWKNSQRLGVGFAIGNGGRSVFIVAQYTPPGNVQGAFRSNISAKKC